jgi:hypothetical protein
MVLDPDFLSERRIAYMQHLVQTMPAYAHVYTQARLSGSPVEDMAEQNKTKIQQKREFMITNVLRI